MVETVDIQQDKGSRENGARWVDCKTMMGILGVSKSTLYRKIDLDEVESTKIGNARLFRASGVVDGEYQTYDMPEIDTGDTAGVEIDTAGIGVDSIGVGKGADVPYDAQDCGRLLRPGGHPHRPALPPVGQGCFLPHWIQPAGCLPRFP